MPAQTTRSTLEGQVTRIAAYLRRGHISPHVLLGPIVWEPKGDDGKRWYFVVATGDDNGAHFDQLGSQERELAERLRASLIVALIQERPLVIHDTDDELEMARWCEAIWPSEKTRRVRAGIEAERAEAGGV
jgi:hypothetical protein